MGRKMEARVNVHRDKMNKTLGVPGSEESRAGGGGRGLYSRAKRRGGRHAVSGGDAGPAKPEEAAHRQPHHDTVVNPRS